MKLLLCKLLELLNLKLQPFTKYFKPTLVFMWKKAYYIRKFKGKENLVKHQKVKHQKVSKYYAHDCGSPQDDKQRLLKIIGDNSSTIFGDNFKNIW